jgi:hypothetical protein
MSADEIIKHIPEIAAAAKVAVAAVPFTAVVKRMLGPAADEVSELLRDKVRLYRYGQQIKCLEKAERMAQQAGFTPQPVPPKILFPLLEGVSFEEDEDLHTMWAALLANAADPKTTALSQPAYADILKQLTPDQAKFLALLYRETVRRSSELRNQPDGMPDSTMLDLFAIPSPAEFFGLYCQVLNPSWSHPSDYSDLIERRELRRQYSLAVDNLYRLRLIREKVMAHEADAQRKATAHDAIAEHFYIASGPKVFFFSTLGFEFIRCCSPPKS